MKEEIRKTIREIVEKLINEKKKDKYKTPVFTRGFYPYFSYDDVSSEQQSDFDGGGVEEGLKATYASGLSPEDIYTKFPKDAIISESEEDKIETLNFFDFDGTLIDSLEPEEGKEKYKEIHGQEYPFEGWWGREESLIGFENKPIGSTVAEYNSRKNDKKAKSVLLTNRVPKLSKVIEGILSDNNLIFDFYSYKAGNIEKPERIKEFLERYGNVKIINVFEDRDKEIALLNGLKNELKNRGIILNIFKVSKK